MPNAPAGWYTDPVARSTAQPWTDMRTLPKRYWDGQAWAEQPEGIQWAPPAVPASTEGWNRTVIWIVVGMAAVISVLIYGMDALA